MSLRGRGLPIWFPALVVTLAVVVGACSGGGTREPTSGDYRVYEGRADPPGGVFVDISASVGRTCGARADGGIECWPGGPVGSCGRVPGSRPRPGTLAPQAWCWPLGTDGSQQFVAVAVDANHGCAVTAEGPVRCWGRNDSGETDEPAGSFVDVSVDGDLSCGVRVDGSLSCWGGDYHGRLDVPTGEFVEVFPGSPACALRADGSFVCWAVPYDRGLLDVPAGVFRDLSVDRQFACAVRADAKVLCWGWDSPSGWAPAVAADGEFSEVSVRSGHACALSIDGDVACWGGNAYGQAEPRKGPFVQVSAGTVHTCALGADAKVLCWGQRRGSAPGDWPTPSASFNQISAGGHYACGVTTATTLWCWAPDSRHRDEVLDEPAGQGFVTVAAGSQHACALRADGTVACWGKGLSRQTRAPSGEFSEIAAAGYVFCGLRTDRTLYCWGDDSTPDGEFERISEGHCGIRPGGRIECWSPDADGLGGSCRAQAGRVECWSLNDIASSPPWAGPITTATRDGRWPGSTCGILADSTIACWDTLTHKQYDAKEGTYTQLSMTTGPLCALGIDGTPRCWGKWSYDDDSIRSASAPPGRFMKVAVGDAHACGIRASGTVACWGSNYDTYTLMPGVDDERETWWWWLAVLALGAVVAWPAVAVERRLNRRPPGPESPSRGATGRDPAN